MPPKNNDTLPGVAMLIFRGQVPMQWRASQISQTDKTLLLCVMKAGSSDVDSFG